MNDRINRIEIDLQRVLNGNQYKILDRILYRSNLNGWVFWTTKISEESGTSLDTTFRVLQYFCSFEWMYQDKDHHYHFDYNKFIAWQTVTLDAYRKNETTTDTAKTKESYRKNETSYRKLRSNHTAKTKLQEIYKKEKNVQEPEPMKPLTSIDVVVSNNAVASVDDVRMKELYNKYLNQSPYPTEPFPIGEFIRKAKNIENKYPKDNIPFVDMKIVQEMKSPLSTLL